MYRTPVILPSSTTTILLQIARYRQMIAGYCKKEPNYCWILQDTEELLLDIAKLKLFLDIAWQSQIVTGKCKTSDKLLLHIARYHKSIAGYCKAEPSYCWILQDVAILLLDIERHHQIIAGYCKASPNTCCRLQDITKLLRDIARQSQVISGYCKTSPNYCWILQCLPKLLLEIARRNNFARFCNISPISPGYFKTEPNYCWKLHDIAIL